jgi:hypothetical protein
LNTTACSPIFPLCSPLHSGCQSSVNALYWICSAALNGLVVKFFGTACLDENYFTATS